MVTYGYRWLKCLERRRALSGSVAVVEVETIRTDKVFRFVQLERLPRACRHHHLSLEVVVVVLLCLIFIVAFLLHALLSPTVCNFARNFIIFLSSSQSNCLDLRYTNPSYYHHRHHYHRRVDVFVLIII